MKQSLKVEKLNHWMNTNWILYASSYVDNNLLRLWVNCNGQYKVVYGDGVLYEGNQMTRAIDAWDSIN